MPVTTIADESAMQTELLKAGGKLVIVDFTATWCGPCQQMAPYFEDLSNKYLSSVFLKVDVDDNADIAMQYEVTSMPTFLFLQQQQEIDRMTGADPSGLETRIHTLATSQHHHSNNGPLETMKEDYSSKQMSAPVAPGQTHSIPQTAQLTAQPQPGGGNALPVPVNLPFPPANLSGQMPTSKLGRSLPPAMQNQPQQLHLVQQPINSPPPPPPHLQPPLSMNQKGLADWQIPSNQMPLHHPSLITQGMFNQSFPPGFDFSQLSQAQVAAMSNQINSVSQLAGLLSANQQQQLQQQQQKHQHPFSNGGPMGSIQDEAALLRLANQLQENLNENDRFKNEKNHQEQQFMVMKERSREVKAHRKKSTHRTKSHHNKERGGHTSGHTSRAKENESHAQRLVKIKKRQPISTVHIRLADGTKMTGQFNINHPVSKIREFINNARPEATTRPFSLNTVFPSREITNEEQTIQEAKLHNSVVVQRWFS